MRVRGALCHGGLLVATGVSRGTCGEQKQQHMPLASAHTGLGWAAWTPNHDRSLRATRPAKKKELPARDNSFSVWADRPPPGAKRPSSAASSKKPEVWKKLSWEEHLKLLKRYVVREGNADVPLEHIEDGVRLGAWLSKQWSEWQADPRGGYLSFARKVRLADAGVNWAGPAPPASGVVGPKYLNERKWDEHRGFDMAMRQYHWQEFDASTKASGGGHWQEYKADADPHMASWLRKQRALGRTHDGDAPPAPPAEPEIGYGHPPVKGLNMELARKLQTAKKAPNVAEARTAMQRVAEEVEAEKARRRKAAAAAAQQQSAR